MYRAKLSPHAVDVLDVVGAELDVPRPSADGWGYYPSAVSPEPGQHGLPGLVLVRGDGDGGARVTPSGACLDAFVRLAPAPGDRFADAVLTFAQRWGMLDICRHGLPGAAVRCSALGVPWRSPWEPLGAWRVYSRQALGLLNIASRLQAGQSTTTADWEMATMDARLIPARHRDPHGHLDDCLRGFSGIYSGLNEPADMQWAAVAHAVNVWWRYGGVKPDSYHLPGETAVRTWWSRQGLAGVLAIQLAAALRETLFACSDCGLPFSLGENRRRPASGRRAYCDQCGKAVLGSSWRSGSDTVGGRLTAKLTARRDGRDRTTLAGIGHLLCPVSDRADGIGQPWTLGPDRRLLGVGPLDGSLTR